MKKSLWAIAALLATGCQEPPPDPTPPPPPAVKVQTVGEIAGMTRGFPGRVRAAERTELSFQVRGRLVELPVRQGDEVKAGALIGRLDDRDFLANVNAARALAEEAAENLKRGEELVERAFISAAELARLRSAAQTTASDLARAEKALEDTRLIAPFDGTVARRHVENFQEVSANQQIVSLQDSSTIEIVVSAPENIVAQRQSGNEVTLKAEFDSLPGRAYDATVKEFVTEADTATQTFDFVLTMPRPTDANILPGMTATVYVSVLPGAAGIEAVQVIPASAIFSDSAGQAQVWLVGADNAVTARSVTTGGIRGNDGIEVTRGLATGDVIATAGVQQLREGMIIRPITRVEF